MAAEPAHPLRLRFDAYMAGFVERLKTDPEFRAAARRSGPSCRRIRRSATTCTASGANCSPGCTRPGEEDSSIRQRLVAMAVARVAPAGRRGDAALDQRADRDAAPRAIERYREDIRRYIVERVADWNADEMTVELERNIGRDLQFIRVNGTLVGGLVGLLIHAATRLAQAP